jgi:hypothetical protein
MIPSAYRVRSQAVWDAARDAYLAGEAAVSVCVRFDLGISAFRARARRAGWRRIDQPDPVIDDEFECLSELPLDDDFDAPHPPVAGVRNAGAADLQLLAWRRVRRAVDGGVALEAMRWMKVMDRLNHLSGAEARDADRLAAPEADAGSDDGDVHNVHTVHGKKNSGASPPQVDMARLSARIRALRVEAEHARAGLRSDIDPDTTD